MQEKRTYSFSTVSTCMYYTGYDCRTMEQVYVPTNPHEKAMQRALIQYRNPDNYDLVKEALIKAHREDLIGSGPKCLIRAVPPRSGGYTSASKAPGKLAKSAAPGKGNNAKGGTVQKAGRSAGKAPAGHSAKASRNARPASSGKKR